MCGGALFERTRLGASPTALGHRLIDAARGVIAGADYIQRMIERESRAPAEPTPIRFGSVQTRMTAAWTQLLRAEFGDVAAASEVGLPPRALLELVSSGKLDACVVFECDGAPLVWPENVQHRVLQNVDPSFIALPAEHPLADRMELRLTDLADEDWVALPPNETGEFAVFWSCCIAAGFTPRVISQTTDVTTLFELVTRGAVLVCQADSREAPGYVVRKLDEPRLDAQRHLAWGDGMAETTLRRLWDCTRRALAMQVDNNPAYATWVAEHPEAFPDLD